MVSVRHMFAGIVYLVYMSQITGAFLKKSILQKRFGQVSGTQEDNAFENGSLFFKGEDFKPETIATRHGSVVLECEVAGTPTPTIHWLKNGVRLIQGSSYSISDDEASYEDSSVVGGQQFLRISSTQSRLFLDCLTEEDEAQYTCVAENALLRTSQTTVLRVVRPDDILYPEVHECSAKRSNRGEPARIYMWTVSRLEFENSKVQLFCRAEGSPTPAIVWYDRDNKPIENDEIYRVAENGDLIISGISWLDNMGAYSCSADNGVGSDVKQAFLYPTPREHMSVL